MTKHNTNTFAPSSRRIDQHQIGLPNGSSIAVVGAGAFGGWSALHLQRRGFKVTLIDAWGAGNSRSSSGDETRVIRSTYGDNEFYFDLNVRALQLWKEEQERWNKKFFFNTGVLWFCYDETSSLVNDSIPFAKKHAMEYERLSTTALKSRFPIVNTDNLHHGWYDQHGGYLKARESSLAVQEAFVSEGGNFIQAYALPGKFASGALHSIQLSNNKSLSADAYLFACGSWMGQVFPEVLAERITCTKQEVFYFGVPKEHAALYDNMPAWVDLDGEDFYYGIPGNANRGFKIGVDRRGEKFDPTSGERISNPQVLADARKFIQMRFPGLRGAPVVECRVCPYENSPDGNFIFESHPDADNLWFLGGGSGHGFKHGPALGEMVAKSFKG
ncbi:MAG: FAD-dependent oxidoreductase [Cyclobacteriaceae bacterium]